MLEIIQKGHQVAGRKQQPAATEGEKKETGKPSRKEVAELRARHGHVTDVGESETPIGPWLRANHFDSGTEDTLLNHHGVQFVEDLFDLDNEDVEQIADELGGAQAHLLERLWLEQRLATIGNTKVDGFVVPSPAKAPKPEVLALQQYRLERRLEDGLKQEQKAAVDAVAAAAPPVEDRWSGKNDDPATIEYTAEQRRSGAFRRAAAPLPIRHGADWDEFYGRTVSKQTREQFYGQFVARADKVREREPPPSLTLPASILLQTGALDCGAAAGGRRPTDSLWPTAPAPERRSVMRRLVLPAHRAVGRCSALPTGRAHPRWRHAALPQLESRRRNASSRNGSGGGGEPAGAALLHRGSHDIALSFSGSGRLRCPAAAASAAAPAVLAARAAPAAAPAASPAAPPAPAPAAAALAPAAAPAPADPAAPAAALAAAAADTS